MEKETATKGVVPRVASFPGSIGKLQSMSSPGKDGDELACANRKSFAGRGPISPSNFSSSPPGITQTRSNDLNDIIFKETPALFARQPPDASLDLSRRQSKRINRTHRGQVLASLVQQRLGREPRAMKPAEGTSSKEEEKQEEKLDTWSWRKYGSKPIPRSSMSRSYYRCMSKGCAAKKMVKSSSKGHPSVTEVIYKGSHSCHNLPQKRRHDGSEKVDSHGGTARDDDNEVSQKLRNCAPPARWLDHFQNPVSWRRKVDPLEVSELLDCESNEEQPSEDSTQEGDKDSDTCMEETQELGGDTQEWGCSQVPLSCQAWEFPGPSQDLGLSQDFTLDQGYNSTKQSLSIFSARSATQVSNNFALADGLESLVESHATEAENVRKEDATREMVLPTPSLCNETDKICSISEPIPTKELYHLHKLQTGNEVLVAGRYVSTWEDRGYFLEFIFLDGQSMSRVLGVGLDHSKVIITCNAETEVIKCEEREWGILWAEAVDENSSFKVMSITSPEQHELAHLNKLSSSEMLEMFGVGLHESGVVKYAYGGADVVHAEEAELESLLWGVANHLLKSQDSTATGRQHTAADSGGGNQGQGNCNNGRDLGFGFNLRNFPALRIGPNQGENGDGDEDFTGGVGKGIGAGPFVDKPLSLRVIVRPGRGGIVSPAFGQKPPESLAKVSGIFPTLTFEFAKQKAYKTISVQILAECALGEGGPNLREKERFGWYHDNIHVSLKCLEMDTSFLLDNYGMVDMGETVKAYISASSTRSTGSQIQNQMFVQGTIPVVGGIVLQSTSNASHNTGGTGTTTENYEMPSKQINGFFYRDESSMGEARLSYKFIFSAEVPEDVWKPSAQQRWFSQSGVCETLKPALTGTWEPQSEEENTPYLFEIRRELHERFKIANSSIEESGSRAYLQEYVVPLYLNHAMTHLDRIKGRHQVINEKIKEIPKVILLGQRFM